MNGGPTRELTGRVRRAVLAAGLDHVGVTDVAPFPAVHRSLQDRKAAGLHAGMSFTFKNPARSTDPGRLLRGARSVVVGAVGYLEARPPAPEAPAAAIARYAWRDHYLHLRSGLEAGAAVLREAGHRSVIVADQNGLVDRAVAHRAGIGWWGKNSNLLVPGAGSWFVLGAVVTDADLDRRRNEVPDGCRTCTRCIVACPTDAIVGDGVIDGRRCLAWLVQARGIFPRRYRVALGDRLYGCDDCQDVCPPGRRAVELSPRRPGDPPQAWVPVLDLLGESDDELLDRYGRWYIPDRQPRYLRRNALVVLGNVGEGADPRQREAVERYLIHPDPLLRAHAVWTAARLGLDRTGRAGNDDVHPWVRAEAALAPVVPLSPGAAAP